MKNCTVEIKTIFTVYETRDERGTKGQFLGKYFDRKRAERVAKGRGAYGSNGSIDEKQVISVTQENNETWTLPLADVNPIDVSDVLSSDESSVKEIMADINAMNLSPSELAKLRHNLKNNLA